jgi:hypothetical protein
MSNARGQNGAAAAIIINPSSSSSAPAAPLDADIYERM